jgi:glutamyl-tRNA reductase
VGPLVKALYEHCHAAARAELELLYAKNPQMSAEEKAELEKLAHRLVGKLLHGPVTQLTTHAEATARPMLTAALKKLFNLEATASEGVASGDAVEETKHEDTKR